MRNLGKYIVVSAAILAGVCDAVFYYRLGRRDLSVEGFSDKKAYNNSKHDDYVDLADLENAKRSFLVIGRNSQKKKKTNIGEENESDEKHQQDETYSQDESENDSPDEEFRQEWENILFKSQAHICDGVSGLDGRRFVCDEWQRQGDGGSGRSCALQDGNVFEKGAVNVAVVHGILPKQAVYEMNSRGVLKFDEEKKGKTNSNSYAHKRGYDYRSIEDAYADAENAPTFYAAGLSLVIHPKNPKAPTVHMNYRFFQVFYGGKTIAWWFGGGSDLTPSYIYEEDGKYFHSTLKRFCDKHNSEYYYKFKKWADEYYTIIHRKERRGIGGIFFDDLHDAPPRVLRNFAQEGLETFVDSYIPIVARRYNSIYTEAEKDWQQTHRG